MGFSKSVRSWQKPGSFLSPLTASDIMLIPVIRTAKPISIAPTSFILLFFENIISAMPMTARIGIHASGLSQLRKDAASAPPSMPLRAVSHAVTAVPTFAPMITPTACERSIVPELTNPTTITVVAEEDCITAVTPSPSRNPFSLFEVRVPKIVLSFRPALFFKELPITSIP